MTEQTATTDSASGAAAASQTSNTAPETTTTQQAASTTTPASTPASETPNPQAAATPAEGQTPTPPAYTPNYKYKAFQKEKELESFWHPLIKDQDSEKKVKDLFTRADAFDDLKARFEGTQTEFSKVYNEYEALDQDVRRVANFVNKGDFDNFFSALNIPEAKIFEWVAQKLEQENLPPEQKRQLQMQAQERQRLYDLENEKSTLERSYQEQAVQARAVQLDMTLARPDVTQAASAWDQRMGKIGAFRDLVIEEAQKAWFVEGKDLSAEQAVQVVLTKYGRILNGDMAPQAPTPQAVPGQVQPSQVATKPVIPAVQGRGTSPVKKSPKSLDDLRQLAKELGA